MADLADEFVDRMLEARVAPEDQEHGNVVTCRRCGEPELLLERMGSGWHLFKMRGFTLSPHVCSKTQTDTHNASAFDCLDN